jgi:hypothetical protein
MTLVECATTCFPCAQNLLLKHSLTATPPSTAAAAVCCCVLLSWSPPREVETLFHEFGHALQHMLTTVDEGLVAGIR